jgi:transcriptional regulator with XRE-family HTH domain
MDWKPRSYQANLAWISEQEFSVSLNIDGNDLAAFEAGEKRINANLLFRIAKLMDVRPDYFFRGYTD